MGKATKAKPADPVITSDQELARHYGVTPKTVYDWRRAGLPHEASGRAHVYRLVQTDAWVTAHRKSADSELSPATRVKLAKEKWKLRQERFKALSMEREEETERRNILPRQTWELFSIELIQQTRDRFLRLPKLLCKHVPQKFHKVLQAEGANEVRKICEEMARVLSEGAKE